jgi:hypothetical protein
MVNPISRLLKTDKTLYQPSLQALKPVTELFIYFKNIAEDASIFKNIKSTQESNYFAKENSCWQCILLVKKDKLYKTSAKILLPDWKKSVTRCQIHNIQKFLANEGGTDWPYQRYTVPNWQLKSENYMSGRSYTD